MKSETEKTRRRFDRIAWMYEAMESPMEMISAASWRRELLAAVHGRVLEVGIGTGKNLPYYPRGVDLTGIDISPRMLARAERRAAALGIPCRLSVMDAERMTFPDATFDAAVATFVFCSVPDPIAGLKEVRRVLKPGGEAFFLEHVRSPNPLLGKLMDLFNPLVHAAIGPNINRRTVENIAVAGFEIVSMEEKGMKILKKIVARPRAEQCNADIPPTGPPARL
ncbi:MAG TPA: class I SAM-dependent methyltransferase [Syntrophales bacterium]|nr:class I SAM-dependent methyltransferase [Syntrophales bacterium]